MIFFIYVVLYAEYVYICNSVIRVSVHSAPSPVVPTYCIYIRATQNGQGARGGTEAVHRLRSQIASGIRASGEKQNICRMYARKKRNRSGSISVVLVSKAHGQYKEVERLGTVRSELEADALFLRAKDRLRGYGGQQEIGIMPRRYPYDLTAADIIAEMTGMCDTTRGLAAARFHKTGKGQYGEGDKFIGLRASQTRAVVKRNRGNIGADEVCKLISSEWHEVRLCGFLLLVEMMRAALPTKQRNPQGDAASRHAVADCYIKHARQATGWDIVDLTCPHVIGAWLLHPDNNGAMPDKHILDTLAESTNIWEQRIAIVSTQALIRAGQTDDTFRVAARLLDSPYDLIHKAVGWMLREAGKRDADALRAFLSLHAGAMQRTTLRYAIERMSKTERKRWMKGHGEQPADRSI